MGVRLRGQRLERCTVDGGGGSDGALLPPVLTGQVLREMDQTEEADREPYG